MVPEGFNDYIQERIYQASGDVVLIKGSSVTVAHYGVLGERVDNVARASLSPVEQEAGKLRKENK